MFTSLSQQLRLPPPRTWLRRNTPQLLLPTHALSPLPPVQLRPPHCSCSRRSSHSSLTPCYIPKSAGSQAPGSDVRACRRRSDIPCQGGHYVLTVVSRYCTACETLTVRKSSYKQASISHICSGLVPQSQAITTTSHSPEKHLKGIRPHVMHCHTYATCTPCTMHACPGT